MSRLVIGLAAWFGQPAQHEYSTKTVWPTGM